MKLSTLKKRLKGFGDVSNMYSPSYSGGQVANQFKITFDNGTLFKSYDSIIAIIYKGQVYLTSTYDYSNTTMKYLKNFLGNSGVTETRAKIKTGEYKLLED